MNMWMLIGNYYELVYMLLNEKKSYYWWLWRIWISLKWMVVYDSWLYCMILVLGCVIVDYDVLFDWDFK